MPLKLTFYATGEAFCSKDRKKRKSMTRSHGAVVSFGDGKKSFLSYEKILEEIEFELPPDPELEAKLASGEEDGRA